MQQGSCNLKDFLEDGGSHSTAVIPPFTNDDFLRLEDKFSFDMCDEKVTRRSQTISQKGLVLVLFHCRVALIAIEFVFNL